jgi:hypothetical protein
MLQTVLKDKIGRKGMRQDKRYVIGLALIVILAGMLNIWILWTDNTPLYFDALDYFHISRNLYEAIIGGHLDSLVSYMTFGYGKDYSPFYMLPALPLYGLVGVTQDAANFSGFFFLAILMTSLYLLGKHMHTGEAGFYAAVICILFPGVLSFSRVFLPDIHITAMVPLTFLLYLRSESFRNRGFSLMAGAAFGLAMMMKFTFLLYILPAVAIHILLTRNASGKLGKKAINAALASIVALTLMLPWYYHNLDIVTHEVSLFNAETGNALDIPSYISSIYSRIRSYRLMSFYVFGLAAAFAAIALMYHIVATIGNRPRRISWQGLLAITSAAIFALLLAFPPSPRYILPLAPYLALLLSISLCSIKTKNSPADTYSRIGFQLLIAILAASSMLSHYLIYSQEENPDIYFKGILFPYEKRSPSSAISEAVGNATSLNILILDDSRFMYSAIADLRRQHKVVAPIACLADRHSEGGSRCATEELIEDICRFDIVMATDAREDAAEDSNSLLTWKETLIDAVKACKPRYEPRMIVKGFPIDYRNTGNVTIYQKRVNI